jgi:hypothetical protein
MARKKEAASNCWFRQFEVSLRLNLKPTYLLQPLSGVHAELKQMLLKYQFVIFFQLTRFQKMIENKCVGTSLNWEVFYWDGLT